MVMVGDFAGTNDVSEKLLLALELGDRILRLPLERRKRLGHEAGHAHRHVEALAVALGLVKRIHNPLREHCDALDIRVGLGGQPVHKIELERRAAVGERLAAARKDFILRDIFIDNVAQPLGSRLRRKSQPALAHAHHLAHQLAVKGVNAHRRQRKADAARLGPAEQRVDQPANLRIVADRKRGE